MSSNLRILLSFIGGLVIGGTATFFVLNKKYEKRTHEEIMEYREKIHHKPIFQETDEDVVETVDNRDIEVVDTDYTKFFVKEKLNEIHKDESKGFDIHMADREFPEDEDDGYLESLLEHERINNEMKDAKEKDIQPYAIDGDEYLNDKKWYDKIEYVYYAGDDTLADERDEIVDDFEESIGVLFKEWFGRDEDDPDVLYIRNEQQACDFEINRVYGKYDNNDSSPSASVIIGGDES